MGILKNIFSKLYKARIKFSRYTGLGISVLSNEKKIAAPVSFYGLQATANNGNVLSFEQFKGQKILLVNVASQCGYTPQYKELEELYQLQKNQITILGFPSNDFGKQEPGTDEEIAEFCQLNFGVTFPLLHKGHVKGNEKQSVFEWLSDPDKNGWNKNEPAWNFYKYLVNETGDLQNVFSSSVSPMDNIVIKAISL